MSNNLGIGIALAVVIVIIIGIVYVVIPDDDGIVTSMIDALNSSAGDDFEQRQ